MDLQSVFGWENIYFSAVIFLLKRLPVDKNSEARLNLFGNYVGS